MPPTPSPFRSSPRRLVLWTLLTVAAIALIGPAPGEAASKIPTDSVLTNGTFSDGATGWSGVSARVRVTRDRRAPDGTTVARVRGSRRGFGIAGGGPTSIAGSQYAATAYVKGAAKGQRATLVITETDSSGSVVGRTKASAKVRTAGYKRVRARYTASGAGNQLAVEVTSKGLSKKLRTFSIDAVSLVASEAQAFPVGDGALTTGQIALVGAQEEPLLQASDAKYGYIVVRDSMSDKLGELRAAHPEAKILLYKNVSLTFNQDDCQYAPYQGSGLSYCDADPNESWFLHKKGAPGQRLLTTDYGNLHMMDVGDSGYQQAWADAVIARLQDAYDDGSGAKYDGVFMDDTNLFPGHGVDGQVAEMSDEAYGEATQSFISNVGEKIQAAGFQAVPNLAVRPWDPADREAAMNVATHVSSINREGFVRYGDSGTLFTTDGEAPIWLDEVKFAEDAQAAGAGIQAITYGSAGDVRGQRYARGTFLMAWDGGEGSALSYRTTEAGSEWQPNWTTDVGVPTSRRRSVGQGFQRTYSEGMVLVNPGSSGSQQFELGGSYRDPDSGECLSSVKLGATRALVMPTC